MNARQRHAQRLRDTVVTRLNALTDAAWETGRNPRELTDLEVVSRTEFFRALDRLASFAGLTDADALAVMVDADNQRRSDALAAEQRW